MIRFGPGLGLRAARERQPGAQPKRVCWSESKLSASAVREVTESLWDQAGRRRGSTRSASAAAGDASRAAARWSSGWRAAARAWIGRSGFGFEGHEQLDTVTEALIGFMQRAGFEPR